MNKEQVKSLLRFFMMFAFIAVVLLYGLASYFNSNLRVCYIKTVMEKEIKSRWGFDLSS